MRGDHHAIISLSRFMGLIGYSLFTGNKQGKGQCQEKKKVKRTRHEAFCPKDRERPREEKTARRFWTSRFATSICSRVKIKSGDLKMINGKIPEAFPRRKGFVINGESCDGWRFQEGFSSLRRKLSSWRKSSISSLCPRLETNSSPLRIRKRYWLLPWYRIRFT